MKRSSCTCTANDVCYPCYAKTVSPDDGLPELREAVMLHRQGLIGDHELYAVIEAHS